MSQTWTLRQFVSETPMLKPLDAMGLGVWAIFEQGQCQNERGELQTCSVPFFRRRLDR
jgi:hypothetical protein